MSPNRRIFLNIVATYGRSLYALVIGLFCGRWTLMVLGETDYGLMGVVGGLTAFVSFLNSVLAGGVGRFYALSVGAEAKNYQAGLEQCRSWFTTAVIIHSTLPVLLMLIGYPLGEWAVRSYLTIPVDRVETCVWVWRFTCISCLVAMVSVPYHAMYGAKQEIAELTIYSFVTTTLNIFFLYYALKHPGLWMGRLALWGCLLSIVPSLIITFRSIKKYDECRFRFSYVCGCFSRVRQMLSFSGWVLIGMFADLLKVEGVNVLINKSFGPKINAANAIANTMSGHCTTLSGSIVGAFWPAITNKYGEGGYEDARALAFRVSKLAASFILLFAIPLSLEVDEVLRLWLKTPPQYSAALCVCVLIGIVFEKLSTGQMIMVSAKGVMALYQCVVGGISLMTLPIACVFVWMGGNVIYVGFAASFVFLFQSLARVVFARRLVAMSARKWVTTVVFPVMFIAFCSVGVGLLPRLMMSASFLRIVITSLCTFMITVLVAWNFALSHEERAFLMARFPKIFRKNRL